MATISVGNIKFNWKGPWSNSTTYAVDDVVSLSGSSYISIQAGSNQNPASASAYWQQMSSAGTNGTNGTDLTSTLTTQGDIVYRDGSGLARLGYGTAGQVLQTGGSGANPSWGTVSSDMVKLVSTTITSSTTQVNFADFANSAYGGYKVFISNLKKTGTTDHTWRLRFKYGSTVVSNSTYRFAYDGMNYHSDNSSSFEKGGGWNGNQAEISNWNTPDTRDSNYAINIELFMPEFKTDTNKHFHWQRSGQHASGTYMNHSEGFGYCHDNSLRASDMTASGSGFIIYPVGDAIASGQFTLYGLKK